MVAVILAAGMGTRLQAVQPDRPKGFVQLGGGPIIARSVRALRRCGIGEFVFVVGWGREAYVEWCAAECPGAACVENPAYATTGSLRSLVLGCAAVPGRDVIVVESDLLFERRAPEALLEAPAADAVLVSGFTGSRDEVWAYAQSGDADRLALLTKARSSGRGEPAGEFVGLSRFSAGLVGRLAAASEALPAAAHYEDGLNAVCAVHPVTLLRIPDLVWCEIDDAGHLQRARAEIWPRVAAADSRRSEPAAS